MNDPLASFFTGWLCEESYKEHRIKAHRLMRLSNAPNKNAPSPTTFYSKASISMAEQEMLARRSARLAVCITFCGVLGGLVILLLFIHYFCVPHMLTATFYQSNCHVTEIIHKSQGITKDVSRDLTSRQLRDRLRYLKDSDQNESALSEPSCTELAVKFTDFGGNTVKTSLVYQSSWAYYQVLYGPQKCLCQDCGVSFGDHKVIILEGETFRQDDKIECYYNIYNPQEVLLQRRSTVLVLNAMLWPTIVFICGFVGLFFACLFAQGDDSAQNRCYLASYFSNC